MSRPTEPLITRVLLIGFQLLFTYASLMQQWFQTAPLDAVSWLVIMGLGAGKFLAVEAEKPLLRRYYAGNM